MNITTPVTPPSPGMSISNYIRRVPSIEQDIRRIFENVRRPLDSSIDSLLTLPAQNVSLSKLF